MDAWLSKCRIWEPFVVGNYRLTVDILSVLWILFSVAGHYFIYNLGAVSMIYWGLDQKVLMLPWWGTMAPTARKCCFVLGDYTLCTASFAHIWILCKICHFVKHKFAKKMLFKSIIKWTLNSKWNSWKTLLYVWKILTYYVCIIYLKSFQFKNAWNWNDCLTLGATIY